MMNPDPAFVLPEGSYLTCHYHDPHRQIDTWTIYFEDGRVQAYDGKTWQQICRFEPKQIQRAKRAMRESGLLAADDLTEIQAYDTAAVTYTWSLTGHKGQATNWAYPARIHPAFEALEQVLDQLEEEAGDRPPLQPLESLEG